MKAIIKQIGVILLASGVAAVVANSVHPQKIPWVQDWSRHVEAMAKKQGIKTIPLFVALQKLDAGRSIFIDARPASEFAREHIPGAVSVPFQSLDDHFETLGHLMDSGRELVLYCRNRECDDALLLAIELQTMGADNVVLYVDGVELWKKHGGEMKGRALSRPNDGAEWTTQRSSLQNGGSPAFPLKTGHSQSGAATADSGVAVFPEGDTQ